MKRRDVPIAMFASAAAAVLPGMAQAQTACGQSCFSQTKAESLAGVVPVDTRYMPGWAPRYGVKGDGITDDTEAFQNMVNGNRGGVCYVPHGMRPMIGGVTLIGSSYDGTVVRVDGELVLKRCPSSRGRNYQGAWVGMAFENTDRCCFDGAWDGNRHNQPANEHIFCIALSGVSNWRSGVMSFREIRGDGLYLDQSRWAAEGSPACRNISVGSIQGYNSDNDGRNLVSVIACQGLTIGTLESYQIGGVIGGVVEPGGFDIEPDFGFQACTDISVGALCVVTAGTSGVQLAGKAVSGDGSRDWCVRRISIGGGTVVNTAHAGLVVRRARDVNIRCVVKTGSAIIDYADHIDLDVTVNSPSRVGLYLGYADFVQDSIVRVNVGAYQGAGIVAIGVNRCRLSGRVTGAQTAKSGFAVQITDRGRGITQTGVVYSIDCPYDGRNERGIYARGIRVGGGTCVRDCDLSGYHNLNVQIDTGGGTLFIPTYNVVGRNIASGRTAAPTQGYWAKFDEVVLDQSKGGTIPRVKCVQSGQPGRWKGYGIMGT